MPSRWFLNYFIAVIALWTTRAIGKSEQQMVGGTMRFGTNFMAAALMLLAPFASAVAQTKMTLGYGSASAWISAFVAKDRGIFAKNGLDVTMTFVPSGPTQPAALDVGTFNAPLLFLADEGGLDLQIVAGGTSEQGKDKEMGRVLARENSNIKSAQDFRGHKIGILAAIASSMYR